MRIKSRNLALTIVGLALITAPLAVGQSNVSMSVNGTYSATDCVGPYGCVAAGLYGGTINGVNVGQGQAIPGMICDDYFDKVSKGETWTANAISVASLNASNIGSLTLFGATIGVSGYTEVAYLANQMLTATGLTSAQQSALSQAIWFITSGGASGALSGQALTYYNAAVAALKTTTLAQFANLYLYVPTKWSGKYRPQEMFSLAMPEGGTALAYLLLAGACCFGAMRFKQKQRGRFQV